MSIREFSKTLQAQASKDVLNRLLANSVSAVNSKNSLRSAASILKEDAGAFRNLGKKQGSTRLIVTEDSLYELLASFGIIIESPREAINLYLEYLTEHVGGYKNKHFEFYNEAGDEVKSSNTNTPLGEYIPSISGPVIAVRGRNFSHDHTLTHITRFLQYAGGGALAGMSETEAKKAVTELYERGHVLATTTGRQMVSIGSISAEKDILDKIVQLSMDLDIASSSLAKPKYAKIVANITKDFSDKRLYMNIEFQAIRNEAGTGNQDSADITRGIQVISSLRKLINNVTFYKSGKLASDPIITNEQIASKVLLDLVTKIEKYESDIVKVLGNYVSNASNYVVDLKSSRSAKEHVVASVVNTIRGTAPTVTKVKHPYTEVTKVTAKTSKSTTLTSSIKPIIDKRKQELDKLVRVVSTMRAKKSHAGTSISSIESILRSRLALQVHKNMGTGNAKNVLNYRTGRFAESASIERLSMSRAGMVSVFYDYMRYPYATFSAGGAQESPKSRDPKLLISKSIREIGASLVGNRMRAILV